MILLTSNTRIHFANKSCPLFPALFAARFQTILSILYKSENSLSAASYLQCLLKMFTKRAFHPPFYSYVKIPLLAANRRRYLRGNNSNSTLYDLPFFLFLQTLR